MVCDSKRRRSDCRAGKTGKCPGTAFNGQISKMNKQTLCPQVYLLLGSCDSDALYLFPGDIQNTLSPDQNHLSTIFLPRYTAADNQIPWTQPQARQTTKSEVISKTTVPGGIFVAQRTASSNRIQLSRMLDLPRRLLTSCTRPIHSCNSAPGVLTGA